MCEYANLRDERIFPPFSFCPDENEIDFDFYESVDGYRFVPKRHWCLLAEITIVEYFLRLRLLARDQYGLHFPIAFYLEEDRAELDLNCFQAGHTIAILYPHQHGFLDLTVGIRQELASTVKVIPLSLGDLLALSDRVQAQSTMIEGMRACHGCGKRRDTLLKCGRCNLSWYCDRKCQEVGWRDKGHKEDCRTLKDTDIRSIFAMDWDSFGGFLQFPLQRS